GVFLYEERCVALRAGLRHGPVPEGEVALGVVRAGLERAACLAALLREVVAVLGTLDAGRNLFRDLAGRVVRAREELPEPAGLDHHRRAALLAFLVGCRVLFRDDLDRAVWQLLEVVGVLAGWVILVTRAGQELPVPAPLDLHHPAALLTRDVRRGLDRVLGAGERLGLFDVLAERQVEIAYRGDPLLLAFLDLVQLFLHQLGEVLLRRETRCGLARLRDESQALPFGEGRQLPLGLVLLLGRPLGLVALCGEFGVLAFLVHRQMAGELDDGPRGPEQVRVRRLLRATVHAGDFQQRWGHLGRDEAVPDQLVELVVVAIQVRPDGLGIATGRGRPDRLVSFLGGLLGLEDVRRGGQGVVPEPRTDDLPGFLRGLRRDPGGVSAHVGDQADRPFLADVHALVELLGQGHGLLGAEAQLARRFLLQPAGDEGRDRIALLLLALDR